MKKLLTFVALFSLVSCDPPAVIEGDTDILRYRVEQDKVTCYRVRMFEGIECLRDEK